MQQSSFKVHSCNRCCIYCISKSATDATTETAPPSRGGKTILPSLTLCYVKVPPCHNCQRAHTREISKSYCVVVEWSTKAKELWTKFLWAVKLQNWVLKKTTGFRDPDTVSECRKHLNMLTCVRSVGGLFQSTNRFHIKCFSDKYLEITATSDRDLACFQLYMKCVVLVFSLAYCDWLQSKRTAKDLLLSGPSLLSLSGTGLVPHYFDWGSVRDVDWTPQL